MSHSTKIPTSRRESASSHDKQPETSIYARDALNISSEDQAFLSDFTVQQRKRLVRKVSLSFKNPTASKPLSLKVQVDVRLIPILTFLYLIAFLDRANIGKTALSTTCSGR